MVCWTYSHFLPSEQTPQHKKENYWSFPAPNDPLYKMSQVWSLFSSKKNKKKKKKKFGSTWELMINVDPKLWSSALDSLLNLLQKVGMRETGTNTYRERDMCMYHFTYRIESGSYNFWQQIIFPWCTSWIPN